jgi:hypothetical protein
MDAGLAQLGAVIQLVLDHNIISFAVEKNLGQVNGLTSSRLYAIVYQVMK